MLCQQPLALGADLVIHSTTKYINGHGDALGGAILGDRQHIDPIRRTAALLGGCASPFNAWLVARGCATLPLRMRVHNDNALKIARFLEAHERVVQVCYAHLPSHPQHALVMRQMPTGCGATLNFTLDTDVAGHRAFLKQLRLVTHAVSLGDLETLVMYFSADDLVDWIGLDDRAERFRELAGPGFFRLSVGVEHVDDLIADLSQALATVECGAAPTAAAEPC
jgi:cystathionine beta-lyase/cystathionine gamma-synthase